MLGGCATPPRPAALKIALERAPKVAVTGVVVDAESGKPVAGIEVLGLPRGKDYPWCPPSVTDSQGRFALALAAPADYSFLLRVGGMSILTPSPDDPGYVDVSTVPGHPVGGIRLKFIRSVFAAPPG